MTVLASQLYHFTILISTHTLTWSVTFHTFQRGIGACNFNSHAHVERDQKYQRIATYIWISTHTLTWSVTDWLGYYFGTEYISTHTLTWSVTFTWGSLPDTIDISTHTLTWSVTGEIVRNWINAQFQLTRSRGA